MYRTLGFGTANFYLLLTQAVSVVSVISCLASKAAIAHFTYRKKEQRSLGLLNARGVGFVHVQLMNLSEVLEKSWKQHISR